MRRPKKVWLHRAGAISSILFLMAGFIHATLAQNDLSPVPAKDYWQLIRDTRELVNQPNVSLDALSAAADRLEAVTAVHFQNGQTIPIDNTALAGRLRANPPEITFLQQSLQAQLDAFDIWPKFRYSSEDLVSLNQILSQPEFQWPEQQPPPWQAALDRLLQRLQAFFQRLLPSENGANILNNFLLIGGAAALTAVLFFSLRGFVADLVSEAKIAPGELAGEDGLTAESALQQAQILSKGGDYRTAVRYLYLSSLLILEERGLLRFDRARTNREVLRSVAQRPDLATILHDVIDVFDRVWYGFQPLDEAAYNHYAARVRSLQQQK